MIIDTKLLRDTLEITLAKDDSFTERFYDRLFAKHPDVREMFFRHSPGARYKMFAQKLTSIVDHLDQPAWIDRELGSLASKHASYGVSAEMYAWVGEELIATLRETCGDSWSDAAEAAWSAAYGELAAKILGTVE